MSLAKSLVRASMVADAWLGKISRHIVGERSGLVVLLFHNIFRNPVELQLGTANPLEGVTIEMFSTLLESWENSGYNFVSLDNLQTGLDPKEHYVLLTFDDGYRSILDVLPILEKYNAPAILFASSHNIETGYAYWPDIVYREELARGKSVTETSTLIESLKDRQSSDIQQLLLEQYGAGSLFPVDDSARPLTANELAGLAGHPLIEIGNHTANHVDLTSCSVKEIRLEISKCQKAVEQIIGKSPSAISYPFGRFNDEVLDVAQAEGLRFGFTCEEGKNRLPLNKDILQLRRYDFLGESPSAVQCDRFRSDVYFCWPFLRKLLGVWSCLRDSH
jgi:peptidoglycan/xylan/chitin deacetylase (PgdA/CDA1 family)